MIGFSGYSVITFWKRAAFIPPFQGGRIKAIVKREPLKKLRGERSTELLRRHQSKFHFKTTPRDGRFKGLQTPRKLSKYREFNCLAAAKLNWTLSIFQLNEFIS
jgi:hypothetical protein